jgi:hypothetical protein
MLKYIESIVDIGGIIGNIATGIIDDIYFQTSGIMNDIAGSIGKYHAIC